MNPIKIACFSMFLAFTATSAFAQGAAGGAGGAGPGGNGGEPGGVMNPFNGIESNAGVRPKPPRNRRSSGETCGDGLYNAHGGRLRDCKYFPPSATRIVSQKDRDSCDTIRAAPNGELYCLRAK